MKTLYFHQSHGINFDQILHLAELEKPGRVVILGESEWEVSNITKEFVDTLKNKNIEIHIVHGSFKHEYYVNLYNELGIPLENITFYNTYWLNNSYQNLIGAGAKPDEYVVNKEFKHKFISLNNRSHFHRCVFIDEMARQNMLSKGVVTWVKHLNENPDYPFQHFDNRQMLLDDDFVTKLDSFLLPKEYHESLLHVVVEATSDISILSEKTCNPILLKKPFLALGAKGFNKELVNLGFKLYDEVFDYSFDDVDDIYERTQKFVLNLCRLETYDNNILYDILFEKIYHNYENACRLMMDKSLIPEFLLDYAEKYPTTGTASGIQQFCNRKIKKPKLLSIWNLDTTDTLDSVELEINNERVSQIIIDQTVEGQYNQLFGEIDGLQKVIATSNKNNVPVTVLTCSYKYNPTIADLTTVKVEDNPGLWIAKTVASMMNASHETNSSNGLDITNPILYDSYEHLYITMNNLVKPHRCRMMDMLAKHELIDKGAIAWRDVSRKFDNQRPLSTDVSESTLCGFTFDYWSPKKMYLDFTDDNTSFVNQSVLPKQYKNSFMQLVAESEDNLFLVSEKTAVPLLFKKPFLTVSNKDFHKNLVDMGFVLYDEVFDYSFDSIEDMPTRVEQLILNIDKLQHCSIYQLRDMHNVLLPKLEHNRQQSLYYVRQVIDQYKKYMTILHDSNIATQLGFIQNLENLPHKFF